MAKLAIIGAGAFAREVAWQAEEPLEGPPWEVVGLADSAGSPAIGSRLNGVPVMTAAELRQTHPDALSLAAVGSPGLRELLVAEAEAQGFRFARLIHRSVVISRFVELGEGTVICAGSVLTVNVVLGRHVQVNVDCTICHDVVMEDFATLAPGAHISGHVHIGPGAYVGTGAVIINGTAARPLVIGERAVIGAGACVTGPVPAGETVKGVPARPRSSLRQWQVAVE